MMKLISYVILMIIPTVVHAGDSLTTLPASSKQFLSTCSSVDASTPANLLIAYVNCMGIVKGYAEGHTMTVMLQHKMAQTYPDMLVIDPLWCIHPNTTDGRIMDNVLSWVSSNPNTVKTITSQYQSGTATWAIITKALHTRYSCQKI